MPLQPDRGRKARNRTTQPPPQQQPPRNLTLPHTHTLGNAGFSRHPRPQAAEQNHPNTIPTAKPSKPHLPHNPPAWKRRLQPAPRPQGRGTEPPNLPHAKTPETSPPHNPKAWNAELHRHPRPQGRGTPPPQPPPQRKPLETSPSRTAQTAWNAGFSRHPLRESAAEWRRAAHPCSTPGRVVQDPVLLSSILPWRRP